MKRNHDSDDGDWSKRLKIGHEIGIDHLPVEMLVHIFKFLSPNERRNVILVRKFWLAVITEHLSSDNCIVLTQDLNYSTTGALYTTFLDRKLFPSVLRPFTHVRVKSFPSRFGDFMKLAHFIELIADEVQVMTIQHMPLLDIVVPDNFYNELIYLKMPNLKHLEVSEAKLLGNITFPAALRCIDVQNCIFDVKLIEKIRKRNRGKDEKRVHKLTSKSVKLYNYSLDLIDHIIDPKLKKNLGFIFDKTTSMILECNHNFCENKKLSFADITTLKFESGIKSLSYKDISQFTNLEKLYMNIFDRSGTVALIESGTFVGIKHLDLFAFQTPPIANFEKVLTSFPDCEYLCIDGFSLQNEHFPLICKHMPKLNTLMLLNGNGDSQNDISIDTMLSLTDHSLKDLIHLQKLAIESIDVEEPSEGIRWPVLPNLEALSLVGWCFKYFDGEIYCDMAHHCPKIVSLTINTEGSFCANSSFLPLLCALKLQVLVVPGEGDVPEIVEDADPNGFLVSNVSKYCQDLKTLTVEDTKGLTLAQEMLLFENIPSLMSIKSIIEYEQSPTCFRTITREDTLNLKEYLKENIHKYKNFYDAVETVMSNVIPFVTLMEYLEAYEQQYHDYEPDALENLDNIRKIFVVAVDFLQMNTVDLCRLIFAINQT